MKEEKTRTYVDIIDELYETIDSDIIPKDEKQIILLHMDIIANLLWPYSG
jgi:hypothetical protein